MSKVQEAILVSSTKAQEAKAQVAEVLADQQAREAARVEKAKKIQGLIEEFFLSDEFTEGQALVLNHESFEIAQHDLKKTIHAPRKVGFHHVDFEGPGMYVRFHISDKTAIKGFWWNGSGSPEEELNLLGLYEVMSGRGDSAEVLAENFKIGFRKCIDDIAKMYLPSEEIKVEPKPKKNRFWLWAAAIAVGVILLAIFVF